MSRDLLNNDDDKDKITYNLKSKHIIVPSGIYNGEMETFADNCKKVAESDKNTVSRKYFLRQLLVCSGLWTTYFITGLCFGAPTVVIPQLRREANSTDAVNDEMASWLSSAIAYSGMPWVIILPVATKFCGRKPPLIFACTMSVASLFTLTFGKTIWTLLLSQILQGILFGSNLSLSIILITELSSPEYRGIFLAIKSASVFWGMWVSNAIGTFTHWNHIGSFGLICSIYYLTIFMWPESPTYFASKGKFEECAKAHRWLKGTNEKSELELSYLITSQKQIIQNKQHDNNWMRNFWRMLTLPKFYKPVFLSAIIMTHFNSFGKLVWTIYSIELIKKITDSESTAYAGMLILDGVGVCGMYVGCILSKFLNRRTLFFSSSIVGIFFLYSMFAYLLLVHLDVIDENKIVSVALLATFCLTISCGPMILSMSIYAELMPLEFKDVGIIMTVLVNFALIGTGLKIAPFIFKTLKLFGTFGFYGTLASILTLILYIYLPETKDKTLEETEALFTDSNKRDTEMKSVIKQLLPTAQVEKSR